MVQKPVYRKWNLADDRRVSIIYTSTLAGVSQDLIEAAKIDGATIIQQIRNVELPALKPVIVIQFILSAGIS